MSQIALIIIDMQVGMFDDKSVSTMHKAESLLTNTQQLIEVCRKSQYEIIYIQHCAREGQVLIEGTKCWDIHPDISPIDGDTIVLKRESSAFEDTELAEILNQLNISTVITCGLQSEFCVANTSIAALEHDFHVIVAQDCHSTFPTEKHTAKDIVEQQNERLKKVGINVQSVKELAQSTHY